MAQTVSTAKTTPSTFTCPVFLFPVFVFVVAVVTFITCYAIAVSKGHVLPTPSFPFISDTGALPPESCIFGELLNFAALLIGIVIYLRHREIMEYVGVCPQRHKALSVFSFFLLFLGFVAAFGVSLVANFQENRVLTVHLVGAFMAFGVGVAYAWCQTLVSYLLGRKMCPIWMLILRVAFCLTCTGSFVSMNLCGGLKLNQTLPAKVEASSPIFSRYICQTSSEWVLVLTFMCYFLSLAYEFRRYSLIGPRLVIHITSTILLGEAGSSERLTSNKDYKGATPPVGPNYGAHGRTNDRGYQDGCEKQSPPRSESPRHYRYNRNDDIAL